MLKNCSSAWEQRPGPQGADGLIMITVFALNAGALEPRQLGLHSRSAPEVKSLAVAVFMAMILTSLEFSSCNQSSKFLRDWE